MKKLEWKRINPSQENGEYIPEGINVLMYNEKTGEVVVGYRYSSMGMCSLQGVTHWMHLPELPVVRISLLDEAGAAFDKLTNSERIIVMDEYCKGCGMKEDGRICSCADF